MNMGLNKHANFIKYYFKKSRSFLSIVVVFLLLSTVASSVVSSGSIGSLISNTSEKPSIKLLQGKNLKETLKEKIQAIKDKISNLFDRLSSKTTKEQTPSDNIETIKNTHMTSFSKYLKVLSSMKNSDNSFAFYTNYNGFIKESELKLYKETKIDVNNDSKNDISVKLTILPGIVEPLSLSINFKLTISRLLAFPDENAFFEAYTELYFPGLLVKNLSGDRVRFGYISPDGETVPDTCDVTYKFIPHLLSIKENVEHRISLNPGVIAGEAKLDLLFSYAEMDDGKVSSELISKIIYNPAVKSEISVKRSKILSGKSIFEFERIYSGESQVDLYLAHIEGDNSTYAYVKDLPKKVTFSSKLGRNGLIEFDTHDESIDEIGICDDFNNPVNKAYFSNLFTKAQLEWNRDSLFILKQGKFNASIYTEGQGVSFNVHLEGSEGGTVDFHATPTGSIINCSMELDIAEGYFVLNRNNFDVSLSFSAFVKNETYSDYITSLKGSLKVKRLSDGPFKILFDDLFDGDVEIYLSGASLEIYDVDITGYSPKMGGNFTVKMDNLVKSTQGSISASLSITKHGTNISGSCRFDIVNGVEITNLSLIFGNFEFYRGNINTTKSVTKWYNFTSNITIVEWHVASDFSSGYILIKGGSFAYFAFNSSYEKPDGTPFGIIKGVIRFKTLGDVFNISWKTVDGNLTFSFDGSGVAELSDFHLWLEDKLDVSIPKISVSFKIDTDAKEGNLKLYLDDNVISGDVNIENINITDLLGITLKCSITAILDVSASGFVDISWNESGITSIDGDFGAGITGSIDITGFVFKYKTLVDISASRIFISGDLDFNFRSIDGNISLTANAGITDIILSDLNIYSSIVTPVAISADMYITFNGGGVINLSYENDNLLIGAVVYDDAYVEINSFWFLVPVIGIEVNLESVYLSGSANILFELDLSKDIPFTVTLYTDSKITAETIYLGYPGVLQLFIYDFIGGDTGNGRIGIGFNKATSQPVFDFDHSSCYIGDLQVLVGSSVIPLSNLSIQGTAHIEGFLDLMAFSYVYLNGEVIDATTITLKNMQIPLLGSRNVSVILEPGKFDFLLQQDFAGSGNVYVYGYSSAWVSIKLDDKELVKFRGMLDLWVYFHQSDDGTISVIIDAKEASGAIVIYDALRIAGELNVHIDFSVKINKNEGVNTISNLNINISGELSAVVQIKANGSDWIPIIPFSTSGQVVLLRQGPSLMASPNIADDFVVTTPENNASLKFEVWYAPPLGEDSGSIGPYTYNLSFGDGTYYKVVTDEARIVTDSHLYNLGSHTASVSVITSDSSIAAVDDSLSFEIIKKITYIEVTDHGPLSFTYDDVKDDGRIHTWLDIHNKDKEDYNLEWGVTVVLSGFDGTGMNPIVDPETGVLGPNETVRVNVSFYPPLDHKEHGIYISYDNINYSGYGDDGNYLTVTIKQSFSLLPSRIYLPSLNPGESITSSIWIQNNKKEALRWNITNYPNDYYSFSSTEGLIPVGGGKVVHFTITAPNENGTDLGGDIEVTDIDDPSNVATSSVFVQTKDQSSGNSNATITEDKNGNISIKIGGYNEITLNHFTFKVNGINGMINGHFVFDTDDSYVYINWTKGNLSNLTIDGDAEFTIENFVFTLGDNISIIISKVITGGIHLREGKSGNFSVAVDNTFTDVDINLHLNLGGTNFSLKGNINIDADIVSDGYMWIDWDLTNNPPHIWIDGNFTKDGTINVSITDFNLTITNLTVTADTFILKRGVDFRWNETSVCLNSGADIETSGIHIIYKNDFEISALNAQCILDGKALFEFITYADHVRLHINTTGLTINGKIYARFREYEGSANIFFTIVGDLWINLYASGTYESTHLNHISIGGNGYVNVNQIYYLNNTNSSDNSQVVVTLKGIAYLETGIETIDIWWDLAAGYLKINATAFSHDGSPFFQLKNFTIEIQAKNGSSDDVGIMKFSIGLITIDAGGCLILSNGGAKGYLAFDGIFEIDDIKIVALGFAFENFTMSMSLNFSAGIAGDLSIAWNETGINLEGGLDVTALVQCELSDFYIYIGLIPLTASIKSLVLTDGLFEIHLGKISRVKVSAMLNITEAYLNINNSIVGSFARLDALGELTVSTDLSEWILLRAEGYIYLSGLLVSVAPADIYASVGSLEAEGWISAYFSKSGTMGLAANGSIEIIELDVSLSGVSVGFDRLKAEGGFSITISPAAMSGYAEGWIEIEQFYLSVPNTISVQFVYLYANGLVSVYFGSYISVYAGGYITILSLHVAVPGLAAYVGQIVAGGEVSVYIGSYYAASAIVSLYIADVTVTGKISMTMGSLVLNGEGYFYAYPGSYAEGGAEGSLSITDFDFSNAIGWDEFVLSGGAKGSISNSKVEVGGYHGGSAGAQLYVSNFYLSGYVDQLAGTFGVYGGGSLEFNARDSTVTCVASAGGYANGVIFKGFGFYLTLGSFTLDAGGSGYIDFNEADSVEITASASLNINAFKLNAPKDIEVPSCSILANGRIYAKLVSSDHIYLELSGSISAGIIINDYIFQLSADASANADLTFSESFRVSGSVNGHLGCHFGSPAGLTADLSILGSGGFTGSFTGDRYNGVFSFSGGLTFSLKIVKANGFALGISVSGDMSVHYMVTPGQGGTVSYQSSSGSVDINLWLNNILVIQIGLSGSGSGTFNVDCICDSDSVVPKKCSFGANMSSKITFAIANTIQGSLGPGSASLYWDKYSRQLSCSGDLAGSLYLNSQYFGWIRIWPWPWSNNGTVELSAKGPGDILWHDKSISINANETADFKAELNLGGSGGSNDQEQDSSRSSASAGSDGSESYTYTFYYDSSGQGDIQKTSKLTCTSSHKYEKIGVYTAEVVVSDSNGTFIGSDTVTVEVGKTLNVKLTCDNHFPLAGDTITFTATVTADTSSNPDETTGRNTEGSYAGFATTSSNYIYEFWFETGKSKTVPSDQTTVTIQYTYLKSGPKLPSVKVTKVDTNEFGGPDTCFVYVRPNGSIPSLKVKLSSQPILFAKLGGSITFTAEVVSDGGSDISSNNNNPVNPSYPSYSSFASSTTGRYKYEFTFGKEHTETIPDAGATVSINYAFKDIGWKYITVQVTSLNDTNISGLAHKLIYIYNGLEVSISADPKNPRINESVTFTVSATEKSSSDSTSNITSNQGSQNNYASFASSSGSYVYNFDFGDGSSTPPLTGGSPFTYTHTYSTYGEKYVTVTVTDDQGNSGMAGTSVNVGGAIGSVQVTPSSWDFGILAAGDSASHYFTVTNIGTGNLNWSFDPPSVGWASCSNLGETSLKPGDSATVKITVTAPTSSDNTQSDSSSPQNTNNNQASTLSYDQIYSQMFGDSHFISSFGGAEAVAATQTSTLGYNYKPYDTAICFYNKDKPNDFCYVYISFTRKTAQQSADAGMSTTIHASNQVTQPVYEMIPKTYVTNSGFVVDTTGYSVTEYADGTYNIQYNGVTVKSNLQSTIEVTNFFGNYANQQEQQSQNTGGNTNNTNNNPGVNHAPSISSIGDKTVQEGHKLSFSVTATDSDGDSLTFSKSGVGSLSSTSYSYSCFSSQDSQQTSQKTIYYTYDAPEDSDCNNDYHTVTVTVTDSHGASASSTFKITVIDNDPCSSGGGSQGSTTSGSSQSSSGSTTFSLYNKQTSFDLPNLELLGTTSSTNDVTIKFNGSGSNIFTSNTGKEYYYLWDFGDGNLGSGLCPTHTYHIYTPTSSVSTSIADHSTSNPTSPTNPAIITPDVTTEPVTYTATLIIFDEDGNFVSGDTTTVAITVPSGVGGTSLSIILHDDLDLLNNSNLKPF